MYTNELCLAVFLDNKLPKNKLYNHELIPTTFLGVKTDVVQRPIAIPLNDFSTVNTAAYNFFDKTILYSYKGPLQPGYAIRTDFESFGTLGAIVFDEKNHPYILTNNHVIASTNKKKFHNKVYHIPYIIERYTYLKKKVAYLSKQIVINIGALDDSNFIDCAIAKILPNVPYTTEIYKIGKVKGVTKAYPGMKIKKVGATTGYTTSVIRYVHSIRRIDFKPITQFNECIVCDNMCDFGDSGSLVVDNDNNAVGLLFAGSDTHTCANHKETILSSIELVIDYLNVHF